MSFTEALRQCRVENLQWSRDQPPSSHPQLSAASAPAVVGVSVVNLPPPPKKVLLSSFSFDVFALWGVFLIVFQVSEMCRKVG